MRRQATVGKISHEKTRSQQLWLDLKEMLPTSDICSEQTSKSDNNDEAVRELLLVSGPLPPPPPPPPLPHRYQTMTIPSTILDIVNILSACGAVQSGFVLVFSCGAAASW